jgi:hypothetical protein
MLWYKHCRILQVLVTFMYINVILYNIGIIVTILLLYEHYIIFM